MFQVGDRVRVTAVGETRNVEDSHIIAKGDEGVVLGVDLGLDPIDLPYLVLFDDIGSWYVHPESIELI